MIAQTRKWLQLTSAALVLLLRNVVTATLVDAYDNNTIHIGVFGPFSHNPELLAGLAVIDLELHNVGNQSKRQIHLNCAPYGYSCNQSLGLVPPGITIPDRHPNLHFVLHFGDSALDVTTGARIALNFAYGDPDAGRPPVNAVVGGLNSAITKTAANILGVLETVQVAYGATDPALSNKDIYPYFFRVQSTVLQEMGAIWTYISSFRWRSTSVLYLSNDYGRAALEALTLAAYQEGRSSSITSFQMPFTEAYDEPAVALALSRLKQAKSRLVTFLSNELEWEREARKTMLKEGVGPPSYQIISSLSSRILLNKPSDWVGWVSWHAITIEPSLSLNFLAIYYSTLYLSPADMLSWAAEYKIDSWEHPVDWSWFTDDYLDHPAVMLDVALAAAAVGNSIQAVLHASNRMLHDGHSVADIRGSNLLKYVKNVSFEGYGFPVQFDENQDGEAIYYLQYLNHSGANVSAEWITFGSWMTAKGLPQEIDFRSEAATILWATGGYSAEVPQQLVACPPGTHVESESGLCVACTAGRISTDYDVADCKDCQAGWYSATATLCMECDLGEFSNAGSAQCAKCALGTFSDSIGTAHCKNCEVGQFAASIGQENCTACPSGEYQSQRGGDHCVPCSPGTFADEAGHSACGLCPAGSHQPEYGATNCSICLPGRYTSEVGEDDCIPCAPGTFQPEANASQRCRLCEVGSYSTSSASSACSPCPYGTTPNLGAHSLELCQCPPGTFDQVHLGLGEGCVPCHEHMEPCAGGQAVPRQREGYFVTVPDLKAYKCVSTNACPGGVIGYCPEGSTGRGCGDCEAMEYYWDGRMCQDCTAANFVLPITLPLTGLLLLCLTHWLGNDPIKRNLSNTSEVLVLLGLNATVLFYLTTMATLDVDWKDPLKAILDASRAFAIDMSGMNFACTFGTTALHDFALVSLLPAVIMLGALILAGLGVANKSMLFNTFGTIINAGFLYVVLQALRPFRYVVHPHGEKAVFATPAVFEGSGEHVGLALVSVFDILFYCVFFVTLCAMACFNIARGSARDRKRIMTRFRFLFFKFQPQAYYWGLCVLARNTCFAVAPSLWPERPHIQVLILAFAVSFSAAHTSATQPWKAAWMNLADVIILLFINLVLIVAMGLLDKDDSTSGMLATVVAICFAVVMTALLIPLVRSIFRTARANLDAEAHEALLTWLAIKEARHEQLLVEKLTALQTEVQDALEEITTSPSAARHEGVKPSLHPAISRMASQSSKNKIDQIASIANRIRQPGYTVLDFQSDCFQTFPELELYGLGMGGAMSGARALCGRSAEEEELRTLGALFAVYWICRLDMDGKEGLSFGVDDHMGGVNKPKLGKSTDTVNAVWGTLPPDQRRLHFYHTFDWPLITNLFVEAGIIAVDARGRFKVDSAPDGRLVAMLALTAFHDIMKNELLCPKVEDEPYESYAPGDTIYDHDAALAYLLDRHPKALPSYAALTPEQQRVVRFTQSEMGFNAGWLVQAEGPPSAVLSKLKRAVDQGKASNSDVAFYFVHWFTDLAGAEPTPLQGTEKFAVKFPPHVLRSLLDCFGVVKELGSRTETEVYEEYIKRRWLEAMDILGPMPSGPLSVAMLRLNCMAQASAKQVLVALETIPEKDREILRCELSETGLQKQEFSCYRENNGPGAGTPFLLYYGPAWVQKAGATCPDLALRVLAAVFRLARRAWPESVEQQEQEQISGVGSRMVMVDMLKTLDLDVVESLFPVIDGETKALEDVEVNRRNDVEGVLEGHEYDV